MNAFIQMGEIARAAEMLAPMCDGDEALFHDMMTAESPVDQVVARLHEQIARDGEILAGIKERSAALAERKKRIEGRVATAKALVGRFLRAAQLTKLELPEVTYSVRDGSQSLTVVDPLAVPLDLCRMKAEPDKAKINEAYSAATELPNWLVREDAKDVVSSRTK